MVFSVHSNECTHHEGQFWSRRGCFGCQLSCLGLQNGQTAISRQGGGEGEEHRAYLSTALPDREKGGRREVHTTSTVIGFSMSTCLPALRKALPAPEAFM
jgi:hypothetical protein